MGDSEARSTPAPADRLEFETLISDTSAALIIAPPQKVNAAIAATLDRVRSFFRADRCSLLNVSADQRVVNVVEASYSSGLVRVSGDINLAQMFPWCSQRVIDGVPTVIPRMIELPPEAAVDRASWASLATVSSLTVPIFTGSTVRHLIAMATVSEERDWPVE